MRAVSDALLSSPGQVASVDGTAADPDGAADRFSLAVGYLRAFITFLVVVHHAMLGYADFAPPAPPSSLVAQPRLWLAMPVVDSQRWGGFTFVLGYNDIFFMSLMFFLSGLFTWSSLRRKGSDTYVRDRLLRLGAPFLASVVLLAPLAYAAAYMTTTTTHSFSDFATQWLSLGSLPAGPAWFLWVLLVFDLAAVAFFGATKGRGIVPSALVPRVGRRPLLAFLVVTTASVLAYVPMALAFHPLEWALWGPFTVQTSRVLHYGLYFALGVAVGAARPEHGLLAPGGRLPRHWRRWLMGSLVAFAGAGAAVFASIANPDAPYVWTVIGGFAFAVTCATSSFAFLALFLRFVRGRVPALDGLRSNAYGIYLFHYVAVAWIQYALLEVPAHAIVKATIVIAGATAIAWATTAMLRRVPRIARVI